MPKVTKLQLDAYLKEWTKEATAGKAIQKGLGAGLLVVIQPNTGKADYYCRKPFTKLGSVNKVTLANAYKKVEQLKPKNIVRKKRSSAPTLKEYFPQYVEQKRKDLKEGSSYPNNLLSLFKHTMMPLYSLKLDELTVATVKEKLEQVKQTQGNKHNTVKALNKMLDDAVVNGDVARNELQGLNPFKAPKRIGLKCVHYDDLKSKFFEPLENVPLVNRVFYLLVALQGFRFNECRLLRWEWIDFDKKIIIIPADAVLANKTQTEYKKPMAEQTIRLLKNWHQKQMELLPAEAPIYVFATMDSRFRGGAISESTFREPIKALTSREQDIHGFRKCIKTYLIDKNFSAYDSELMLSHDIRNSLEKTYDKGERIESVRECAQSWADYLERAQLPDNYLALIK